MRALVVAVIVACATPPTPSVAPVANTSAPTTRATRTALELAIDDIAHQELERYLVTGDTLPDHARLDDHRPIRVLTDVYVRVDDHEVPATLSTVALPSGRSFALVAMAALQAEADRLGREVAYVHFDMMFDAERSWIAITVDVVVPRSQGAKECCCRVTDYFDRHDGRWTYTARRGVQCE